MKCKKTIDARAFSHATLEEMRTSAVKRVADGESPEAVAVGLGVNRRTMYRWLANYHYGGANALKAKPIPGAPRKLGATQMERLARIVRDENPLQRKFEYALWTLAMIRELIRREFDVAISEVSVGRLMKRLGFSPQRPLYRAWQQNPVLVETWRNFEYPQIAARAKREGAMIFFADESGLRSDHHAGTTWAPVGKTPVIKATGARYGLNMLSAVSATGNFRFMLLDGRVNAGVFVEFLQRLIKGMRRKVFLIVDGHPAHKAKLVRNFAETHADRIELFYLPPYAPELNPDELVWAHVKTKVAKVTAQTKVELTTAVERVMRRLQEMPKLVASFFHVPTCAYAKL
jgi:transposase